jgi:hypothetical protein
VEVHEKVENSLFYAGWKPTSVSKRKICKFFWHFMLAYFGFKL